MCELCDWKCADCELSATECFDCWDSVTPNILNWLNFTCVSECPEGTYYDETLNECPVCNYVCKTCTGGDANSCSSCNQTETEALLYLDPETSECVLSCRLPYTADDETQTCKNSTWRFLNIPFFIILFLTIVSIITIIVSKIVACIRKKRDKTLEQIYAYLTAVEFVN